MTCADYKSAREKRGYTQTGLAALLCVNRVTISRRETGGQPITREAWLALLSLPNRKKKRVS